MLIFGQYGHDRLTLDIPTGVTVGDVRDMIQKQLNITIDQYKQDKKVLVLTWASTDLNDAWVFSDLGIVPGTTIRVKLKEEVKPVLYIHCSHSQETISVHDNLTIGNVPLEEIRSLVSRRTGLPVGCYRLMTQDDKEMYDGHRLEDYGIDVGHTIFLKNLDGWNEFLNLAILGFTSQVMSQIVQDEINGRYQMKVALFIAAHYGHVDLARAMLRQGIRASEPIGYPPQRMWCVDKGHIESKKAAVHEAVEMGQLGVLRLFVNHDITVITVKDGNDMAPINIALRKKIKNCAQFLLTKQWSKVNITKTFAMHVGTYTNLRLWCERAKERVFLKYGQAKSSIKRRPYLSGPLIGFGVHLDGYTRSNMTGKSKAQQQREKEKEKKKQLAIKPIPVSELAGSTEDPEIYFRRVMAVQNLKSMSDRIKGNRKTLARVASHARLMSEDLSASKSEQAMSDALNKSLKAWELAKVKHGDAEDKGVDLNASGHLPSISKKLQKRLVSQLSHPPDPSSQAGVTNAKLLQELQSGAQSSAPPLPSVDDDSGENVKGKNVLLKLTKSRGNAYFMTRTGETSVASHKSHGGQTGFASLADVHLPTYERMEKLKGVSSMSVTSEVISDRSHGMHRESMDTSSILNIDDPPNPSLVFDLSAKDVPAAIANARTGIADDVSLPSLFPPSDVLESQKRSRKKRRARVTSALLLSKAKSTEGSIPLPLVSQEQDRRPFFYYNGRRESSFIEPTISLWSKHARSAGDTPRDRAIKSLTIAESLKDKRWLSKVRIALNMTSNPLKRNILKVRSNKQAFVI